MATIDIDSSKVKYDKVKVNFNEIIKKLHLVAKDFANKENSNIKLENLAFDAKENNFIGGGNKCIMMIGQDGKPVDDRKGDFLDVVKTYVHYFCGEEEEGYIKENNLYPITDISAVPNAIPTDSSEVSATSTQKTKDNDFREYKESFDTYRNGKIFDMLFEADEPPSTPPPPTGEEKGEQDEEQKSFTIGYSVPYNINVQGKKDSSLMDSIKGKMRGLFGGVLADLRNIKIKIGGQSVQIGKVLDWDKWKEAAGVMDIDIKTVPRNIQDAFDSDFPNNDVNVSSIKVWGKQPLTNELNRQGKLSPDIKSKINSADYSIQIAVSQKDPNYPNYDTKSIAQTVTKALGTYDNLTNRNKVTQKDVIKLDDMTSIYKTKSNYDKPGERTMNGDDNRKEQKNNGTNSTTKNVKESVIYEDGNEEEEPKAEEQNKETSEGDGNNKEGEQKKDPKVELIESDKYLNEVNSQVTTQNEKILKKLGDSVDTQYKTNQECIEFLDSLDLNDAEFLNNVKKEKENCLVTSITKDFGKTLKESNDLIQNLLRKYDIENGLIVESEEEKSEREITDEVIDRQNPYQDPKLDKEYHINTKKRVDSQDAVLNTIQKMTGEVQKAFKNVFLNTQNKFEQLKDVKPEFKMFQTNKQLDDSTSSNESLEMYSSPILKLLFEGDGNNSPQNAQITSERLEILNCALIGGVSRISHWYEKDENTQQNDEESKEEQEKLDEATKKGGNSKPKKNNGRNPKPKKDKEVRDESTYKKAPQSNFDSRQHITPYCVVSETENVINYMKNHNIGDDTKYGKMRGTLNEAKKPERLSDAEGGHDSENDKNKYKYCAIVIKKHSLMKDGEVQVFGGAGHESLDDSTVQKMLDSIIGHNADVGEDEKVEMIHCENQNKSTMNAKKGELLEQNLAFHNEKGKGLVPVLDVWVRPFNLKEDNDEGNDPKPEPSGDKFNLLLVQMQQLINNISINNNIKVVVGGDGNGGTPIPPSLNIKMKFIFIMPDPIVIVIKGKGDPDPIPKPKPTDQEDKKKKSDDDKNIRTDWYIIPHKDLKPLKERPHQETHYSDGTTKTQTSKAEYKP